MSTSDVYAALLQGTSDQYKKLIVDSDGKLIAVGTFSPTGLSTEGKDTEVDVDDTGWTLLPTSPLSGRNSIFIQNQSDVECKTTFVLGATGGYVGLIIEPGGFYSTDITDSIVIYGRAISGSSKTLLVREIK